MKATKVLLLGGGLQGLSFGESLYRRDAYELSSISNGYDIWKSRFFKKVFAVDHSGYEGALNLAFSESHFDVIVPMGDSTVSYLSKHKKDIENRYHTKCAVVDQSILSIVADKSRFMEFCKENGFPHPHTSTLSQASLVTVASDIGFPSLIKPDFSVGARGITRVNSEEELKALYPKIQEKYGACTLQEFIDNPDYYYNVMMYRDSEGNCDNSVVIKIVRMYPVKAGSSSCCISVDNSELVAICQKVLNKLNWIGMADFDVLQRKDTLEYKIVEINPRVPASLRAAYISGVNFPEMIVRDVVGEKKLYYRYNPGRILRYLGIDILWFIKSPHRFSSSPSWFRFLGKNVFYQDIFQIDFSTWYSWIIVGIKKIKRR